MISNNHRLALWRGCAKLALGLPLLASAACSDLGQSIYPNPPATFADISKDYADFRKAWDKIGLGANEASVKEADPTSDAVRAYTSHGFDLVDNACETFFTNLRKLRNNTDFLKDASKNVIAAAGVITSLTSVPTAVLTGIFGASGLVPDTVSDYQKIFLFGEAGDSLYPKVKSALLIYRQTYSIDDSAKVNRYNASLRVRQYATLCSTPYLTYIVKIGVQGINKDGPPIPDIKPATPPAANAESKANVPPPVGAPAGAARGSPPPASPVRSLTAGPRVAVPTTSGAMEIR